MTRSPSIRVVEVGPRDGLQNESVALSVPDRVALIDALADAGLKTIEAGSFVSTRSVPRMAETGAVLSSLAHRPSLDLPVLVPNARGFAAASAAGARSIAVFTSASESFSQRNIGCGIAESLARYEGVVGNARRSGMRVRGYVSCVLGCPYEGRVSLCAVLAVATALVRMGCDEVSFGDTIGVGTPDAARALASSAAAEIGVRNVALHFHDTYGQALANVFACLDVGVTIVDAAVAGLGGCPHAPGASGNLATEDLVYMLEGMGVATGVDLERLAAAGRIACAALGIAPRSRVAAALAARVKREGPACSTAV
jgi:hydroxymethylglutaryl-CoA lyase